MFSTHKGRVVSGVGVDMFVIIRGLTMLAIDSIDLTDSVVLFMVDVYSQRMTVF